MSIRLLATTKQLINNASHMNYQKFEVLTKGQSLSAYLKPKQAAIRQYLPIWAAPVISAAMPTSQEQLIASVSIDSVVTTIVDKKAKAEIENQGVGEEVGFLELGARS